MRPLYVFVLLLVQCFDAVGWLGDSKGIRPVKNLGEVVGVRRPLVWLGWCPPGLQYLCPNYLPLLHKNPEDRRWGNPV